MDNNIVFKERVEKLGIKYDNLLQFESHFESGNLQLAYITESLDEIKNMNNHINTNKNTENNLNNSININSNINNSINNDTNTSLNNINMINIIKKEEIEKYELFLHNDTNTSGYTQWFFFRVSNIKKGKKVNFNIMNFLRKRTKYSNGMKIWCYSRKNSEINKIGWHHTTEEVKYYKNFLYKLNKGRKYYFYTLSFNYTFQYDNDEVFFANCIPFTYTDLNRDLNRYTKNENDKYIFFNRRNLCSTIIGNTVEFFTINNSTSIFPYIINNDSSKSRLKNGIVLFGRQHPSETVGSWTLKGAIDFLMGESDEAKYLRDNFIFKIIPMINVDGVICGNTRTSLSGCDLNRRWSNPNILLHPEIFYCKEMIMEFCKKYKIECIVDFHGHFGAFNSFFYGNHKEDNFSSCRYFPFTCAKKSKVIQFEKSKFKMPKYKRGTGRINLFKELDVENVVTLETSYFGCNSGGYINQYFNIETLQEIGRDICNGILLFHYHSNLQMGINNNINNYPFLQKKVENDEKMINSEFTEYLHKYKNEILKENKSEDIDNKSPGVKNEDENEKNNNTNNENQNQNDDNDDDDDYLNDDITDSESEPSRDNFDENEIIKLLPPVKKLKKIFRKHYKKKRMNKKNVKVFNHNISNNISNNNSNNININNNMRYNLNANILKQKSNNTPNNMNLYSLPKLKDNFNKNKFNINNIYNSIDINSKSNKEVSCFDDDKDNNRLNQKNNSFNKKELSSKNTLFKINPTTPNINNIKKSNINININISLNQNSETAEKSTQTEEIFFKSNWRYFIGKYKILTPKIDRYDKYPVLSQLKPIKFNAIKNSYSFTNKNDIVLNNSVLPIPHNIDLSHPKRNREYKILNIMKSNKFNFDNINNKKGNRNSSMMPFGPLYNNLMDNSGNIEGNGIGNYNNSNTINIKNQRINIYPVVKSKDIFLNKYNNQIEN